VLLICDDAAVCTAAGLGGGVAWLAHPAANAATTKSVPIRKAARIMGMLPPGAGLARTLVVPDLPVSRLQLATHVARVLSLKPVGLRLRLEHPDFITDPVCWVICPFLSIERQIRHLI
jgi:hypothetical protein